jgi:sortase (surface protein transpeptidase)
MQDVGARHQHQPAPAQVQQPKSYSEPAYVRPVESTQTAVPQHVAEVPPLQRIRTNTAGLNETLKTDTPKRLHLPRQLRSNVLKRQMVKTVPKKHHAHKHRRSFTPALLTSMAILLFASGLLVVFSALRTNHTVKAQVKQLADQQESDDGTQSDGIPSEDDPPKNVGSYSVAPDLPKLLTIDKLGVNARVIRLGVNPSNVLKAPSNIFDVGWYEGSAKPGENGTMVIDGHVSGPTKHGVFYSIKTLAEGDKVKVTRGDGKVFTYTVTGTQVYDDDKVDMVKVLTSSVPGKPALNFMTCTGKFDVRSNKFEQRVVVFTVQDS